MPSSCRNQPIFFAPLRGDAGAHMPSGLSWYAGSVVGGDTGTSAEGGRSVALPCAPLRVPHAPKLVSHRTKQRHTDRPVQTGEQTAKRRDNRKLLEHVGRNEDDQRERSHESVPLATDAAGMSRTLETGDFVCPYSFQGELTTLPADSKLVDILFDQSNFVKFRYVSKAEAQARYELLTEPDLGISIELVDPQVWGHSRACRFQHIHGTLLPTSLSRFVTAVSPFRVTLPCHRAITAGPYARACRIAECFCQAYEAPPSVRLAPKDELLLSSRALSRALGEQRSAAAAEARSMRSEVTWLRKTPLMGNNLYDAVHKYQKSPIERQHVHPQSQALARYGDVLTSFGDIIAAIEQSFADVEELQLNAIEHPVGTDFEHVTPVDIIPVLPDDTCWENSYVQAVFGVDPGLETPTDIDAAYVQERVAHAIIKQFRSEQSQNFRAHGPSLAVQLCTGALRSICVGHCHWLSRASRSRLSTARAGAALRATLLSRCPAAVYDAWQALTAVLVAHRYAVGYLLPPEGLTSEGAPVELEWVRDYTFEVKPENSDSYFVTIDEEKALYNAFERRIALTRAYFMSSAQRPARVSLSRRELDAAEQGEHDTRRSMLLAGPAPQLRLTDRSAGPPLLAPWESGVEDVYAGTNKPMLADLNDEKSSDPLWEAVARRENGI